MKDPAFLFYPGDWSLGTMHMTFLEKGAYIELLMLQFARDKFTIAHAKHMLNGSFDLVWTTVSEKFVFDGEYYWNERLKIEKEKRSKFSESRRSNASKQPKEIEHMLQHIPEHMLQHMEDENIISLDIPIVDEKPETKKPEIIPSWRTDYSIYISECNTAYRTIVKDENFIMIQSRLNPNVNVKLSIEKGYTNFWGKDLGWKHKKKSKSKDIDWESTIVNSIGMNKVYYTKDEQAKIAAQ